MSDLKISQLTDGNAAQAADEFVVARSGGNFRIDGASVAAAATSVGTLSSLTVSGDLTVDTSTLKVDSANNAVGIGTTTPTTYASGMLTVSKSTASGDVALSLRNAAAPVGGGVQGTIINFLNDSGATNALAYIQSRSNDGGSNGETSLRFGTYNGSALGERMRLNASGNLGLGVTPPAWESGTQSLNIGSGTTLWNPGSGTTSRLVTNAFRPTGGSYTLRNNGAASMYEQSGNVHAWYNVASGSANDTFTWTQAMTLDASGGLQVLNAIGVGNTAPTTSGAGITFPATQSASSNANTLDDYEEGTFTPTLSSGFSVAPTSYSQQTGTYVKIGRVVYFLISINPNGATANATTYSLGGLPFTVGAVGFASVTYQISANTNTGDSYHVPALGTDVLVYKNDGNARNGNDAGVDINALIAVNGFYYV
jgi:hypothetical protein